MGPRFARWLGVVGLGWRRTRTRAFRTAPRQTAATITGVAVPVALLLVVTSVSLGLAGAGTVASPDVDYWIVPEAGSASAVVPVEGPRFSDVHGAAERLSAREDVTAATPVLLEPLRLETNGQADFVLVVGVVPGEEPIEIAGTSTAGLARGDPHFADGSYDGPRSDEIVLSDGAATLLEVSTGDRVDLVSARENRRLTVSGVSEVGAGGEPPVAVMHLAELQALTGTAAGDAADQLLVRTNDPFVRPALESVYPRSTVVARSGPGVASVIGSPLALAVAIAALVVAVGVGWLSVVTTMGLVVVHTASDRAVLAAVGFSARTRAGLLGVEALVLTLAGGVMGVVLWWASLPLANQFADWFAPSATVVQFQPKLVGYGIGVALLVGLLVWPYLVWVSRRTTTMEALVE